MKIYEWKDGSRFKKDPQVIGEYIERVAAKSNGKLIPSKLINLASDPKNVLHDMFEWDDSLAAKKYREEQARSLLRSIVVTIDESKGEQIRAFVNIKNEEDSAYKHIGSILLNPPELQHIIDQARKELSAFVKKYEKFKALSSTMQQIKKALQEIPEPEEVAG